MGIDQSARRLRASMAGAVCLAGCSLPVGGELGGQSQRLETVPLIITEVAQNSAYGGTNADKVEVFCSLASGCAAYRVCDTRPARQRL